MIDTSKYEGHSKGPWYWDGNLCNDEYSDKHGREQWAVLDWELGVGDADKQLIADAPLLLAEVKRLRGLLMKGSEDYTTSYMDLRGIIEDVHWELTGDEHESNEARIKHALIALREVIG